MRGKDKTFQIRTTSEEPWCLLMLCLQCVDVSYPPTPERFSTENPGREAPRGETGLSGDTGPAPRAHVGAHATREGAGIGDTRAVQAQGELGRTAPGSARGSLGRLLRAPIPGWRAGRQAGRRERGAAWRDSRCPLRCRSGASGEPGVPAVWGSEPGRGQGQRPGEAQEGRAGAVVMERKQPGQVLPRVWKAVRVTLRLFLVTELPLGSRAGKPDPTSGPCLTRLRRQTAGLPGGVCPPLHTTS